MKFLSFVLFLTASLSFCVSGGEQPKENKYVRFSARMEKTTLRPGETATLSLTLTPAGGIHINLEPPMSFLPDTSQPCAVTKTGGLHFEKMDTTAFLNSGRPITLQLKAGSGAAPGTCHFKGTFSYFFCSDAEGWCSRWKQPVDLTVRIGK
jgi:hypothetical protein